MKNIKAISLAALVFMLASCSDWLNVKPIDQVLEDEAFESERTINHALNGLYMKMADEKLYGKNLTFYVPELLGQRYNTHGGVELFTTPDADRWFYTVFSFGHDKIKGTTASLFAKGYNLILDINFFIRKMEKTGGVVSEAHKNLLLGEAYALRAYMHLDLLRLFGPINKDKPEAPAVPYYTQPTNDWQDILSSEKVIELILKDIDHALTLLANDPVLVKGVATGDDSDDSLPGFFYEDYRNRRLNFYAVQALKVRTLMYQGDTGAGGALAKNLIENPAFEETFPWAIEKEVFTTDGKNDKAFSREVLFGIHVPVLYEQWNNWFSTGISSVHNIMGTARANVHYMFNTTIMTQATDWRARQWVEYPDPTYLLTMKFQKTSAETDFWYFQPLIRKSELYLAAAEVYGDAGYVNEIRSHRGLKTLEEELGSYDLQVQIEKEYMKDFVSEGQLFYYYKRRGQTKIQGRTGTQITLTESNFTLPLPQKEQDR